MAISQTKSKRKYTGGKYNKNRKKKLRELGHVPTLTKIKENKKKIVRVTGGNKKVRLLLANSANVYDPKTKKYKLSKIISVVENKANRQYVRRNIITKGAVIETDAGKARVTSRPGQEGIINAVLV